MCAFIHLTGPKSEGSWPLLLLLALVLAAWLATLVRLLRSTELDGTTKICWVVVLCTLNVLGLVLFMIWGPKKYEDPPPIRRLFEPAKDKRATDDPQTPG
jgi:hypothetical protein